MPELNVLDRLKVAKALKATIELGEPETTALVKALEALRENALRDGDAVDRIVEAQFLAQRQEVARKARKATLFYAGSAFNVGVMAGAFIFGG